MERCEKIPPETYTSPPVYYPSSGDYSPPERDAPPPSTGYTLAYRPLDTASTEKYYSDLGKSLTREDLEEYARSYEVNHQKQPSYAQSEGYHSYVSR